MRKLAYIGLLLAVLIAAGILAFYGPVNEAENDTLDASAQNSGTVTSQP